MPETVWTRAEALVLGLPRYLTLRRCKHGHVAERYTSNSKCVECCQTTEFLEYNRAHKRTPKYREYDRVRYTVPAYREYIRQRDGRRRARKLQALPPWAETPQGQHDLAELETARELFAEFNGVPVSYVHLDHVIPLRAVDPGTAERIASGLHVADNLVPMLGRDNIVKGNRLLPEKPPAYHRVTFRMLR